jgi:hypothetical protein
VGPGKLRFCVTSTELRHLAYYFAERHDFAEENIKSMDKRCTSTSRNTGAF